ncbi:glycerophosphodiester phosphodiesterase [Fredinandcohnia sp. QZ13]|uniref:glycerophosphodiester phosphodiesterase n=1 Tax=Fredinandcohnia sp. QZ13 TaxID=3073144 RepID=UPI00285347B9|nr:glycerophosphodiester phosphodiesterase [Fredinandcohnia sp. QZ13]MDR4887748.1 glycerophosphodiester phosphodiesterase [Fredinandcohnia sp. QZ13]
MTKIYGHRGAKGIYPENTLLSFKKAIEQGVDGLELDVHLTQDGEVVVIHDETLDRTTSGVGWIKDLTLAEIKKYSAGRPFTHFGEYEEAWDKERVPTLKEVLELLVPYDTELNIELKTSSVSYEGIEEKVQNVVEQYAKNRKVIYSSFHLPTILRMKQLNPSSKIAWLLNNSISLPYDYINTLELEALHLNKSILLPKTEIFQQLLQLSKQFPVHLPIEVIHYLNNRANEDYGSCLQGLYDKVRVWTVNDPNEIEKLLRLQVEAIITDYPERAIRIRNQQMKYV